MRIKVSKDWESEIKIEKVIFELSQDGNTNGTTEHYEDLIVEFQGGIENMRDSNYIVLRTSSGWSIDTPEELEKILTKLKKSVIKSDSGVIDLTKED